MKRWIAALLAMALAAATACGYSVSDLPTGWGIDPNQVQGTLLPAYAGTSDGADPNTWLMPIGDFVRDGGTNGWVARLAWVATNTSDSLELHHDVDRGYSTTWRLDGWVRPGPNYKVIDAWSWPTFGLFTTVKRYTVVVIGVVPEGTEPELN